ncbi:uncharacterized protein METZ01_LOCUS260183 [marine metagenome]|uniref:Uncharacterized protein n=1 Tax=marine metagenome TaxID=408172 RepID=A0A382J6T9_9ZZZZ
MHSKLTEPHKQRPLIFNVTTTPPCILLNEFVGFGVSVDVARHNNSLVGPWPSNGKTIFV